MGNPQVMDGLGLKIANIGLRIVVIRWFFDDYAVWWFVTVYNSNIMQWPGNGIMANDESQMATHVQRRWPNDSHHQRTFLLWSLMLTIHDPSMNSQVAGSGGPAPALGWLIIGFRWWLNHPQASQLLIARLVERVKLNHQVFTRFLWHYTFHHFLNWMSWLELADHPFKGLAAARQQPQQLSRPLPLPSAIITATTTMATTTRIAITTMTSTTALRIIRDHWQWLTAVDHD